MHTLAFVRASSLEASQQQATHSVKLKHETINLHELCPKPGLLPTCSEQILDVNWPHRPGQGRAQLRVKADVNRFTPPSLVAELVFRDTKHLHAPKTTRAMDMHACRGLDKPCLRGPMGSRVSMGVISVPRAQSVLRWSCCAVRDGPRPLQLLPARWSSVL